MVLYFIISVYIVGIFIKSLFYIIEYLKKTVHEINDNNL